MVMVTDKNRQRPVKAATYRRSCLVCAMVYNYVPAGKDKGHEHKRGLFCSWACKSKHIAESKPGPHTKISFAACGKCGKQFVKVGAAKYCSIACRPSDVPTPSKAGTLMTRDCAMCGEVYEFLSKNGRPQWFCGSQCRDEMKAAQRRIAGAANKAMRRAAIIEKVDPFVVFERDGWKCSSCGVDTPRELRGAHVSNSPELDHIMPISKGGKHSYSNTQCMCRGCNIAKADKILPNISSVNFLTYNVA